MRFCTIPIFHFVFFLFDVDQMFNQISDTYLNLTRLNHTSLNTNHRHKLNLILEHVHAVWFAFLQRIYQFTDSIFLIVVNRRDVTKQTLSFHQNCQENINVSSVHAHSEYDITSCNQIWTPISHSIQWINLAMSIRNYNKYKESEIARVSTRNTVSKNHSEATQSVLDWLNQFSAFENIYFQSYITHFHRRVSWFDTTEFDRTGLIGVRAQTFSLSVDIQRAYKKLADDDKFQTLLFMAAYKRLFVVNDVILSRKNFRFKDKVINHAVLNHMRAQDEGWSDSKFMANVNLYIQNLVKLIEYQKLSNMAQSATDFGFKWIERVNALLDVLLVLPVDSECINNELARTLRTQEYQSLLWNIYDLYLAVIHEVLHHTDLLH